MKNIFANNRYRSMNLAKIGLMLSLLVALLYSCTENIYDSQQNDESYAIKIEASYPVATRVSGNMFADGDRMGIYVVDYEDGMPGTLSDAGNNGDNVMFTFDESANSWEGVTDLYFKSKSTNVDIYGYYPYDSNLSDVDAYQFSVKRQQDKSSTSEELGGYEASDLLRAKAENIAPTTSTITLTYKHLMAGIRVTLQKGSGFDSDDVWNEMKKTVLVSNIVPNGTVNLATGSVTQGEGSPISITPYSYNGEYRAVVIPQTIDAGKTIISITVGGVSYAFTKQETFTYSSGKMHQFTITVDRREDTGELTFSLASESIVAWVDDADFHDGIMREYVVINVQTPGTLQECIAASGEKYDQIESLKVTGTINQNDIDFMGQEMTMLSSVNLKEVTIKGIDGNENNTIVGYYNEYTVDRKGFSDKENLEHIVLPDNLKKIGNYAFGETGLTGNLVIPEGVTEIGYGAFRRCHSLTGTLTLPSTLKTIGSGAFFYCDFHGELILPEGLETINGGWVNGAFEGNSFSGQLILPESLKEIGQFTFDENDFSGDLVIPQGIKIIEINAFSDDFIPGQKFDGNLFLPEGLEEIADGAFGNSKFRGELVLPSTVKIIGKDAFVGSNFSSISFPDNLLYIDEGAFSECTRLSGTLTIPPRISNIKDETFSGCRLISSITFPETVELIGKQAFANCTGLNTIVCNNPTPPTLDATAFDGVSRNNVTVVVPASSVSAYQRADSWKEFGRISAYNDFVCSPSQACALNSSREQTITLNADGDWTVEHLPSWCKISQTSGSLKTLLTLTIDALPSGSANRVDSVVFKHIEGGYLTQCKVSQYNYEYDEDETVTLQTHSKGNGINIIFIGDGFDAASISDGSYLNLVKEQMEYFFGIEPYTTYRDYFDVYASISLSQDVGINTANTFRDTRFLTIYSSDDESTGTTARLIPDDDLVFDYIIEKMSLSEIELWKSLVIMTINSSDYGGATYLEGNGRTIAMCPPSESAYPNDTRGIVQHEAGGHGFGKLGEEKITSNSFATSNVKDKIYYGHQRGWYQNLSTSGKASDVPWSHLIYDSRYSDYVDIYEGGWGHTRGVYRSEANSCMNYGIPYYNAISRQAIVERIMDYAGEEFTLEKFFASDTNEWGSTSQAKSRSTVAPWNEYVSNGRHRDVTIVKGNELKLLRKRVEAKWKKNRK